jgi:anti-sigma factor (TIGR02949 family)
MKTSDDGVPMKECDRVMTKVFDLLDGELTPEKEKELRSHITSCPDCFTSTDFEQRFKAALQSARGMMNCPEGLKNKLMSALRAEGFSR